MFRHLLNRDRKRRSLRRGVRSDGLDTIIGLDPNSIVLPIAP